MLTPAQQTQLAALIAQEGGLTPFTSEVTSLYVAATQAAAMAALTPAITVTITDWTAIGTYVAGSTNATLYTVMGAIATAAAAKDQSKMGPYFVALYAAAKAHLGL